MNHINKILLSQPKPITTDSIYFSIAKEYNVEIDFESFIDTQVITPDEFRKFKPKISEATTILFTNKISIDNFFILCKECNIIVSPDIKYIFPSEQISVYINKYIATKKRKVLIYDRDVKKLEKIFESSNLEKYILVTSHQQSNQIINEIKKKELNHIELPIYNLTPASLKHLEINKYDIITFFSPIDVDSFMHNFPSFNAENTLLAAFGINTILQLNKYNLNPEIKAPLPDAPSMGSVLQLYLKENQMKN